MFRRLFPLVVLACAGGVAACGSQAGHGAASAAPTTSSVAPAPSTSSASPSPSPTESCASASDFVKALDAEGATGFRVDGRIVCEHDWATAHLKHTRQLTDPNWTVLRLRGGRWHLVIYGTDGLCESPGMGSAPAKIKKALGPYC
jgi:hypothetical protein